jgi:hypothetical protein
MCRQAGHQIWKLVDLADAQANDCTDVLSATLELEADKNDEISCELGI